MEFPDWVQVKEKKRYRSSDPKYRFSLKFRQIVVDFCSNKCIKVLD